MALFPVSARDFTNFNLVSHLQTKTFAQERELLAPAEGPSQTTLIRIEPARNLTDFQSDPRFAFRRRYRAMFEATGVTD